MSRALAPLIGRVRRQLADGAALCARPDELADRADAVSAWSVAQQLEHMALVDASVLGVFEKMAADPEAATADGGTTALGRLFLALGWIPRGRGQAPKGSVPKDVDAGALRLAWQDAGARFEAVEPRLGELAAGGGKFRHPVFGALDVRQWVRFLGVHHHHHWKIVQDIRRARGR